MKHLIIYLLVFLGATLFVLLGFMTYYYPSIWSYAAAALAFTTALVLVYEKGCLDAGLRIAQDERTKALADNQSLRVEIDELRTNSTTSVTQAEILENWRKNAPDLSTSQPIAQRLDDLRAYLEEIGGKVDMDVLSQQINAMTEARDLIDLLQRNVTLPYQQGLHQQPDVVDVRAAHTNLVETLQAFMKLFDAIDSFHSINARPEQSLNVELMKNNLDLNQALSGAVVATGDPMVTPKWIRVLVDSMKMQGVTTDDKIIISGYRMNSEL